MQQIVDLHIHSPYARATSPSLSIENIYKWCKIKGINVVGTGDFTHPLWMKQLQTALEPAEPGMYKVNPIIEESIDKGLPESIRNFPVRFIPTVEISNIYRSKDKLRRVHNLIIVPTLTIAKEFNYQLGKFGRLNVDGRPVMGIDSKQLLRMTLDLDEYAMFIPAHIWTPWFALFGSKSGFDSIEEAFDDLAEEITAVESGLSSDPYMNWRFSNLDKFSIVSFSDAHSLTKLGREATILDLELDYYQIADSIKHYDESFVGTVEFYPEEGKYHYDGHKKCKVSMSPAMAKTYGNKCPKCGKKLTLGVLHRIERLADRPEEYVHSRSKKVEYIVPLVEIIAELKGIKDTTSKKVAEEYRRLITVYGNELFMLRNLDINAFHMNHDFEYALAIKNMREGNVKKIPGYDGVYGSIKLFNQ